MVKLSQEALQEVERARERLETPRRSFMVMLTEIATNPSKVLSDLTHLAAVGLELLQEQDEQRVSEEQFVDDAFFEAVGFTRPALGSWVIESEHHRVRVIQGMLQLEQKKFQGMQSEKSVILGEVETTKRWMIIKFLDSLLIPHK